MYRDSTLIWARVCSGLRSQIDLRISSYISGLLPSRKFIKHLGKMNTWYIYAVKCVWGTEDVYNHLSSSNKLNFRIFECYLKSSTFNTGGRYLKLGMVIQYIVTHSFIHLPWQYSHSIDQSRALFRFWGGGGGEHVHSKITSEAIDMGFFVACSYDYGELIPSWGQVFGWPHQYVATHWWEQKPGQGDILTTLLSGQKNGLSMHYAL